MSGPTGQGNSHPDLRKGQRWGKQRLREHPDQFRFAWKTYQRWAQARAALAMLASPALVPAYPPTWPRSATSRWPAYGSTSPPWPRTTGLMATRTPGTMKESQESPAKHRPDQERAPELPSAAPWPMGHGPGSIVQKELKPEKRTIRTPEDTMTAAPPRRCLASSDHQEFRQPRAPDREAMQKTSQFSKKTAHPADRRTRS